MKGYIYVKIKKKVHTSIMLQDIPYKESQLRQSEVNPGNRFRDIKSFQRKLAQIVALLDFFKILTKNYYCPMKGYIRAKNKVNPRAEGENLPAWRPFWFVSKF